MPSAEKPTIPQQVTDLVARFDRNRDAYKSGNYNETQVRREFVDPAKCASPTSKRRSVVASMPSKQFDPSARLQRKQRSQQSGSIASDEPIVRIVITLKARKTGLPCISVRSLNWIETIRVG